MAYILGFFTADGSMMKNKRGAHFVEFEITDKDLLIAIRKELGSNYKITARKRSSNRKMAYRLQIGSKIIFNDLLKLGLTPNKSKTIDLPKIPKKYFSHFTRGYFDGDGNVTIAKYTRAARNNKESIIIYSGFTSGSKKFLENLQLQLKNIANLKGGTLCFSSRGYRLYFSVKDSFNLYNFLYKDCGNLYLPRKKRIFEKYFKIG